MFVVTEWTKGWSVLICLILYWGDLYSLQLLKSVLVDLPQELSWFGRPLTKKRKRVLLSEYPCGKPYLMGSFVEVTFIGVSVGD